MLKSMQSPWCAVCWCWVTRRESQRWRGDGRYWAGARCLVSDQIQLPPPPPVRCSPSHYGGNLCIECHEETGINLKTKWEVKRSDSEERETKMTTQWQWVTMIDPGWGAARPVISHLQPTGPCVSTPSHSMPGENWIPLLPNSCYSLYRRPAARWCCQDQWWR